MTSREDALPANFMGASLKGGGTADLRKYLRELESKQRELLLLKDVSPDQAALLANSKNLIFKLKAIIEARQKARLAELFDVGDGCLRAAPLESEAAAMPPRSEDVRPLNRQQRMAAAQRADPNDMLLGAAMRNDSNDIRYLVEEMRVDPNHANEFNQSALHVASLWGNGTSALSHLHSAVSIVQLESLHLYLAPLTSHTCIISYLQWK